MRCYTNTKTLVVGQEVYMLGDVYIQKGKVVKITPEGLDVRTSDKGELLQFDKDGKQSNWEPVGFRHPDGWFIALPEWP